MKPKPPIDLAELKRQCEEMALTYPEGPAKNKILAQIREIEERLK